MNEREELAALRRLAELEAKAGGRPSATAQVEGDAITRGAKNFAADMPLFDQVAAGLGKAAADAGRGIKGLFTDNSAEVSESRSLDAPLMDTGGGLAGNIGGQVLTTLAPGGALAGAGKLASLAGAARAGNALSSVGRAAMAPTTVRGAAGLGAAAGLTQPALDFQERMQNTALGAGGAAGGQAALRGLARVVRPKTDANALALLQEGITPTPGQLLGGNFKRAEDAATSLPIVGDAIVAGQRRAVGDLNSAAFARVLDPIGEKLPKGIEGRDAVTYLGDRLSARYDALLPKLTTQADGDFITEIASLRNMMGSGSIDPAKAKQFEAILQTQVLGKFQPGANGAPTLTGETLKAIEGDLGNLARQYRSAADPDQRQLGDALLEVQSALRGNVERSNPQLAGELRAINKGYANLVRVEGAAGLRGAKDGVFSASQLGSAVKAADKSRRKRAVARGDALMQDLSDPAEAVLGASVPDSGTARRLLTSAGVGGGMAVVEPTALAGALGAGLMYSRPGQNALAALLARRPDAAEPIANALRRLAPYAPLPALAASNQQR